MPRDSSHKDNLDKAEHSHQSEATGPVPPARGATVRQKVDSPRVGPVERAPTHGGRDAAGQREEGVILPDDSPPRRGGTLLRRAMDR